MDYREKKGSHSFSMTSATKKTTFETLKFPVLVPTVDLSDDDDEDYEDRIKTGWNLYEKIFTFFDGQSLLESRLVCRRWNEVICKSNLLWSSLCIKIENRAKWPNFKSPFSNYLPNFHFEKCDNREEFFRDFFISRGSVLKYLKLTDCILTLPNLQTILVSCEKLEHLEILGITSALSFSETIFPKPFQFRRMTALKRLILRAVDPPPQILSESYLRSGFLQDLIEYSTSLEAIELVNWSGKTINNFMNIVNQRSHYKRFVEFHATEIRNPIRSIDLIPLCVRNAHINLKKISICPADPYQRHDFGIMIIRGILRNHRLTLEQLNLTNCPVNSTVFRLAFPKLRSFTAIHTNISSSTGFKNLTPNLEEAIFYVGKDTPRESIEQLFGTFRLPTLLQFERHLANRLSTLRPGKVQSNELSVIKEFDACSMFDFVCLVLFAMSFLGLFVFGLSMLFQSYSPLILAMCVIAIFIWEIYDYYYSSGRNYNNYQINTQ